jgi:signal transduction histidine kinase
VVNPAGAAYAAVASGVVAFILPKPVDNAVMWFRPQITSTMNWGGDPAAHVSEGPVDSASHRLHPRQSFDLWAEQTSGIARPWSIGDLYAAEDIRRSALEIDLARQVQREQEAVRVRDELVAVVSHDLRNPMSIIIMQCGMMQRWAVSDTAIENSRIRRALGTIESATTRMNTLLEDLLDAAKIDAGGHQLSRVAVNVAGLLQEACNLLVNLTKEKSIELNCTAAPGLVINADPERVFQVLSNLLGNAIKFTPQGGRIDIDALPSTGQVLFQVRDSGTGIPAEHLPHIFKRYWSVKEGNPRGNGLGLYISQGIITAHGGALWADSTPGAGSVFSFTLPLYDGPNSPVDALSIPPLGFPRLLLDSVLPTLEALTPDTLATRAELLNELNHRVKNTLSTAQAIAALTASNSDSLPAFRKDFEARLHALSQAHDALAQVEWTSTQLVNLIEQVRAPFGGADKVSFEGDAVTLEPRTSLTLALVLHELMANAAQHGSLSLPQGRVAIQATLFQSGNAHALKLDWVETDGPPVAPNETLGFGFRLLRRSVERELKGTLHLQLASAGFRCSLTIPVQGKQTGSQ